MGSVAVREEAPISPAISRIVFFEGDTASLGARVRLRGYGGIARRGSTVGLGSADSRRPRRGGSATLEGCTPCLLPTGHLCNGASARPPQSVGHPRPF